MTQPGPWPAELQPVFERAQTVDYASLTRAGLPITFPCSPYLGDDGQTLDVSTGLTYPAKAERARANPKVSLLFADAIGSGLDAPPVVLIQGVATVRDRDLQWNTDRYVRLAFARYPEVYGKQPRPFLRLLRFYWARIWVQITPVRIRWWAPGALDQPPMEWHAAPDTVAAPSDPRPPGKAPPAWQPPVPDWRRDAERVVRAYPLRSVSVMEADGFPASYPVRGIELVPEGFSLQLAAGLPPFSPGPGCLLLHTHPEVFSSQSNKLFVGTLRPEAGSVVLRVERQIADWSIPSSPLRAAYDFLVVKRRVLGARLHSEAARRGQLPPRVNLPPTR